MERRGKQKDPSAQHLATPKAGDPQDIESELTSTLYDEIFNSSKASIPRALTMLRLSREFSSRCCASLPVSFQDSLALQGRDSVLFVDGVSFSIKERRHLAAVVAQAVFAGRQDAALT
jgi:hypothetical protein